MKEDLDMTEVLERVDKVEYTREELNQSGIYCIKNLVNGKIYIGSAINFGKRWYRHKRDLRLNIHCARYLQASVNKYDIENFEFKIIEAIPKDEIIDNNYLIDVEQMWLDAYRPEYNQLSIANSWLGYKHTEETKIKLKGRRPWLGKKHSEETKAKIRIANIGHKRNLGNSHSKESRLKIAASNAKNIYKFISPEGNLIEVINVCEFCRKNILNSGEMYAVHLGKSKTHKGYRKYIEGIDLQPYQLKVYSFISPEGNKVDTINMTRFCKDNNLDTSAMYDVHKGKRPQHKGWRGR